MDIVVLKFGGTSVSSEENRLNCLTHIQRELDAEHKVVVVVSAMGRKGDPYATDTLLSLTVGQHLPKRELDLLLSTGELISASTFSTLLHQQGISNTILTGGQAGIITDDNHNEAKIISLQPDLLLQTLEQVNVVIVPGFQGVTEDGFVTTLGRGGSDTSASALGVAVQAKYVDIFTDVKGIMTADPRMVADAVTLKEISYREATELAHLGAKVIHPRAVEMAMRKNIPLRVRSTFSSDLGTTISNHLTSLEAKERIITGITHTSDLSPFTVSLPKDEKAVSLELFRLLKEASISLDFINIQPHQVTFSVTSENVINVLNILERLNMTFTHIESCSKVSLVGANMSGLPGIMYHIMNSLYAEGIDILQTTDSHTTIWVLIPDIHTNQAINVLHAQFDLHLNG